MFTTKMFPKLTALTILTICSFTFPALSQSYYWPSASFFIPRASGFESEDSIEQTNLSSMLELNENHQIFKSNLQESGVIEILEKQNSLTVLAPTNEAFAALSPKLKAQLSDPENLKKVLQYHLVLGNIEEKDIQRQGVATLLKQSSVEITGYPISAQEVGVKLNDAKASTPLFASDGVIIPIDRVLIPPTLQ